jgi:hypothetical protein
MTDENNAITLRIPVSGIVSVMGGPVLCNEARLKA